MHWCLTADALSREGVSGAKGVWLWPLVTIRVLWCVCVLAYLFYRPGHLFCLRVFYYDLNDLSDCLFCLCVSAGAFDPAGSVMKEGLLFVAPHLFILRDTCSAQLCLHFHFLYDEAQL